MQPNQHFIENLIALRNQYQALLEEHERLSTNVREQLTHINALLVERLVQQPNFDESLIALRDHYQALLEEYSRSVTSDREQLTRVNALLVDRVVREDLKQPVSIQASTVKSLQPYHSLLEVSSGEAVGGEKQPITPSFNDEQSRQRHVNENQAPARSEPADIARDSSPNSYPRRFPPLKTSMLPKYQHLSKTQAIETLLRDNASSILHIDYIIRALYGELEADAIKAEKPRLFDTLSKGTAKGLWDKVPDQTSCYTIDLKLVDPQLASKKVAQQSKAGFHRR